MTRIITIRPEPGGSSTVDAGKQVGLAIEAFPLSHIVPCSWEGPAPEEVDALLVGSANVIRMGGHALDQYRDKPIYAVGESTAEEARQAGFKVELAGRGGLQRLLASIQSRPLRMLRLAGARMVKLEPPMGMILQTCVVYEAPDVPMPDNLADILRSGDVLVMLHSAGAAEHFRSECERLGIDLSCIRLAALGPRIAEAAGDGWAERRFAEKPANGVLLALAKEMCQ